MKYRNKTVSVVLDVRSRLEFLFGHVRGAVNIPAGRVTPDELERRGIARDGGILLYCASGARSAAVYQTLKGAGYRVVDGGALAEVRLHLRDQ